MHNRAPMAFTGMGDRLGKPASPRVAWIALLLLAATPVAALAQVVPFVATNGAHPTGPLALGPDGNFYGTTAFGGATSTSSDGSDAWGTIFSITPSGTFTLLYSFTGPNGTDGSSGPVGGLVLGADGNFYGMTDGQNGQNGPGTIYQYTPGASAITTLHIFTGAGDGGVPAAGLVQGADGNFYGTASQSGAHGNGTIFSISPPFTPTGVTFQTLYSFCSAANCTDGGTPLAGLVQGTDGNFYGTTSDMNALSSSGSTSPGPNTAGTIFSISPPPGLQFKMLYSFCPTGNCTDGATPTAGLVQGTDGNFYGTTSSGGQNGDGTVFQYTPGANAPTTLFSFTGGTDGSHPAAALVQGTDGKFYGTAASGGSGAGTMFQMILAATPPVTGVFSFDASTQGSSPVGLVQADGGNFWVTTKNGGPNGVGTAVGLTFGLAISGQVTLSGKGLSGVTITLTSGSQTVGSVKTNASGNYSFFPLTAGASFTVKPSLSGFTFTPSSANVSNLSANQTQNFTATRTSGTTFTISGQVALSNGTGVSGVTMTLSGSASATTSTNASGNYTFTEPAGGTYTVTPTKSGFTFTPPSQTFNNLSANQTQNFTAATTSATTFTISGQVTASGSGLSGVTMTLSGSASATTSTDASGNYTFTEPAGGNYTVTPTLSGDTFTPLSQTFNNLSANQTQNFIASQVTGLHSVGSFAHFASGGGQWTTTFTILNIGTTPANITLSFFDSSGNPLPLPLINPTNTTASYFGALNPGAALVIATGGLNGPLLAGWAQLMSDGDVSGFLVFTDNVDATHVQQAVVSLQTLNSSAYAVWFDNTNNFSTAVALANISAQDASVTLVIRDDTGAVLSTQPIFLKALSHQSYSVPSQYPVTGKQRGTLEFDSPNGQISVLALSFNPKSAFTSIPAISK